MIRVLIVVDLPLLGSGLRSILDREPDLTATAEIAPERLSALAPAQIEADLALCALERGDSDGVRAVRRLLQLRANLRIVYFAAADVAVPAALLDAGVHGYLARGCDARTLVYALRRVAGGHDHIDASLPRSVLLGLSPFRRLSAREREVALLTVQDYSTRGIAELLGVDESTVRTVRSRAYRKLGLRSAVGLSRLADKHGFGQ
ncbi:response regulator transcription factor [Lysobacter firmicutimachus]|uniref:Response regulator transcription factor n=1 Tax=Lysobacter firmicutimachus TaxID=1792846 RepID=A0AAU8MWQ9_9GAMM